MPVRPDAAARNAILDSGLDFFDGATITMFDGTQPATGGGAHADNTLASGTLPTPAFAAGSGGARAVNSNWTLTISATGTAGWARITKSGADIDMDIGEGSGSLNLDETALVNGGVVTVSSGGITLPGNDA